MPSAPEPLPFTFWGVGVKVEVPTALDGDHLRYSFDDHLDRAAVTTGGLRVVLSTSDGSGFVAALGDAAVAYGRALNRRLAGAAGDDRTERLAEKATWSVPEQAWLMAHSLGGGGLDEGDTGRLCRRYIDERSDGTGSRFPTAAIAPRSSTAARSTPPSRCGSRPGRAAGCGSTCPSPSTTPTP
jgi:hypothetical protein